LKFIISQSMEIAQINFDKKTFTYKKTDQGLELKSDVYLPNSIQPDHEYPVVVHFHGGGFIFGDRDTQNTELANDLVNENWIYITFDYRLCPEVKINELWSDCEDHWKWVITELPKLLNIKIDESNMAALGESAGGYLSLLSGYKLHPRPSAIAVFFPFVSVHSDFWNLSTKENTPPENLVSEETYKNLVQPKPIAGVPISLYPPFEGAFPRATIMVYLRQEGLYIKTMFGLDRQNPDDLQKLLQWNPAHNISKDYPPVILLHGDKDPYVPITDSEGVVESLKKNGVEHQFVVAPGYGHGFSDKKGEEGYDKYIDPARLWLKKYLNK